MVYTQFFVLIIAVSVVYGVYVKHGEPYNPHPRYNYAYKVHDSYTGDVKSHHESRDGDVVKGSYSLVEPDGTKRTVHYTADDHHGFQAVVHTEKRRHRPTYVTPRIHKGYYKTTAKAEMSHLHASYNH